MEQRPQSKSDEISKSSSGEKSTYWEVYQQIYFIAFQIILTFIAIFGLYPGTLLSTYFQFLEGVNSRRAWFNIIMVSMFAIFNTLGRLLVNWVKIFSPKTVIIGTLFRLLFFATSILIQIDANPSFLFHSDWFKLFHVIFFSISGGYISALLLLYAPDKVNDNNKDKVGLLMNFHILAGSCIGTTISVFGLSQIPLGNIEV